MKYSMWFLCRWIGLCALLVGGSLSALAAPPVLSVPGSVTVGEDQSTNVAIGLTDAAVPVFTVTTTATSSNTNLISNSGLGLNGSGTNRMLLLAPLLHKSGTATITIVATDSQPSSTTNTFSVTVTATNYPPTFLTSIGNLTRNENAVATNLSFSISDIETPAASLTVTATSSNTSLVGNNGLVLSGTGTNRTLTVTQVTNQFGTTLIELMVTDGGGATATNDFVLTVWPVNQPPTFTMNTNRLIYLENYGPVSNSSFITGVTSGPANQSTESNHFVLTYTTNFYTQAPALDTNGNLTFQVATNVYGTNTITFALISSGSTTNGGKNSLTNTLTLDVPFVNQAPSFGLSTNAVQINEETLAVTNIGFLTNLSAGPSNENNQTWSFALTTLTNNATNVVFTALPVITTNGTLIFHPAAHSYGTNWVTVVMTDSGGTNNSGINTCSNSFQIEVAQTNHAPVIVATNMVVVENNTNNLTATVNVWDYDTQSSNLTLTTTSLNTNLASVTVPTNTVPSATNAVFTIAFAPVPNANGVATVRLVATEGNLSTTNNITLTITSVNQAPSFTLSTNAVQINEETLAVTNVHFLTNISAGPTDESAQTWTFTTITTTNSPTNVAFTVLPAIATNGTLTFHPAAHSYGTNWVTVIMTDSGGTNNGGVNTSSNTFEIEVAQTNHAPVIVVATNFTVLENNTNVTATVNVWDYDTQSSNLTLTATALNTNLASVSVPTNTVPSATNAVFTLAFTPNTNANGIVTVQLVATEGPLSTTNNITLTITAVNQAPGFSLSTNAVQVNEETLAVTNIGFLTNISAGPTNEKNQTWTFALTTATNNATNVIFTALPVITTNGTLIFHPAAHSYGTNWVTVVMTDSGGTNNGGVNTCSNSFVIEVAQTNHAPVIVATNMVVVENNTNVTATVNVWDYDTQSSNLTLTATALNTNLASVTVPTNTVPSATNAVFTLAVVPVTNANGVVTIQLVATEGPLSTTNNITLTITAVNQAPRFTLSTNAVQINEETLAVTNVHFLTNISAGPLDESAQTWTFTTITTTNSPTNVTFTVLPAIATNGTLTFHPAAHSYGTNWVTVIMTDSGGTNNGGVNTSSNTFEIEVAQTNHAPVIVVATNFTVLENYTNGTATVNVWDYDTQSSNLTLTATALNTNLASVSVPTNTVPSATNAVFTLAFTPNTNANGSVTVQLVATEGPLSTTNNITLTITAVNQAPSFTLLTNAVQINEETLAVTNLHFLTNISAGPPNESNQTWTFALTTATNNATNVIFTALPVITTNGTLSFHPAAHSYGTNWVSVIMTDSGGANNGGVNACSNSFVIEVAQTNHAPVIVATNMVVLENSTNGLGATVNVWDYDTQSSNLTLTATSLNTNLAAVTVPTNIVPTATNAVFTLAMAPVANANGIVTIQLVATEGPLSTTNNITLTLTAVNQAPSFTLSTNAVQINEETLAVTNLHFLTNISAGPTNENNQTWTFTTITATNSATNVAFTVLPAIATNGALTFHPAAHSCGTNWVTVIMTDSGGTNNGGVNTSSNTFVIEVAQTNHAPVIVVSTNFTVLENSTNGTATVNVWDYDAQSSNLTLTATSLNTNIAVVTIPTNTVPSATNAVFTLNFTPVTNANGVATVRLVATEGSLSTTNTFTLTVTAVNQAPSFTLSTNAVPINEETLAVTNVGFLTNISAGPANESSQTWAFALTTATNNATNVVFTVLPAIATNGTLIFHPAAHSYGTNWVTVIMTDSGGTNNGGVNTCSNTFVIEVAQTNHAPVIVVATNFTVLENNTNNLTATVNVWDYDTQSSNLTLTATSLNTNIASVTIPTNTVPSATNAVFTLNFAPATNANGVVTIRLVATEGALSTTNNFTLTITAVNQAPSFTLSTNAVQINEETLAVTNIGFLTNISAGPTNESTQTWAFTTITATNNATNVVFTSVPTITTNGTLIFHPAAHSYGTNWVSVVMTDSGGTNNGGVNTCSNSFQIEVAQANHAPVIVVATNFTVLENNTNNLTATVNVWDYDTQSSNLTLTATSLNTNLASVTIPTNTVPSATNAVFTLNFTPVTNANGVATVRLVATEGSLSTTNTFTLTITAVNQAPSFTLSTNAVQINEETLAVTNAGFLTNISAGPSNESSQTWAFALTTATNSATNVVFTSLPLITTNGTLIFHPAAHSYGTNWVSVVMTDSGGTNNGGVNTCSNSFQIEVAQTNHAPVIVVATNFIVLENNTNNLTATVNVWDYDTQSSNLTLTATALNTNIASITVPTNTVPSATNAVFTLNFAPVTNANGVVTIQLVATEGALSTTNNFTLTITAVNQAPTFTLSTNAVQINEETLAVTNIGFLTNISAGPTNESAQTWAFTTITATNNATNVVFTSLPTITTNGTLIFHPAAHSYGTNWVTVIMTDSGGTNNGGVNTCSNSFQIEVAQTNHAPVIVVATNFTVLENNTNGTATVNVWDYDTQSSNLTLTATSLNTNLASVTVPTNTVPSATNAVFTLNFTPVTNANGVATVRLVATEGSLSTTNTFTLTVTAVNQAPSFTLSTNAVQVNEETLAVTNVGFLTNISAGPSNESSQTWAFALTTATNSATNVVFTALPLITTNGTLIFHPAAHSYGTNWVSVVMTDSGGTNNGGVNTCSNSFQIEVAQTNHAPVIVVATNFTILENSTNGLTATVNVWDYDTQSSNLTLTATALNTNIASVTVPTNTVPSSTNAVFTLNFAPVTNANGVVTVQLVATEGPLSTTNNFTLTITAVNQAPTFTLSTNVVAAPENAGVAITSNLLTGISAGPTNENNQTWAFTIITPTNNATNVTFAQFPTISTNGILTFKTTTNSFGTNLVTVIMTDSGGTNNGGVNTYSNSFQLQVAQVFYAPIFIGLTNKTILENATTNLNMAFTLYDHLGTNFNVTCLSSNTNLVNVTLTGSGSSQTLVFAPVTNANGSTTVSLTADDGIMTNSTNITLTILAVNQAPSFNLAITTVTVDKFDVAVSRADAVTNISAGPTNESSQTVTFTVTNSSPSSFLVQPAIDTNGTLTFTPGGTGGTITVGIKAVDNGGTLNGGVNTSAVQTMTITIPANPFPYLTGPFAGLFFDTNNGVNASSGYFSLTLATNGSFTGYVRCAGDSNTFTGQFDVSNAYDTVTAGNYVLDLTIDTSANWTETVSGAVSNSVDGWSVSLQSYLLGYSASEPTSLAGTYLMDMPGFADPTVGPAGNSVFSLTVSNGGTTSLTADMADNTVGKQVSQISFAGYYPLYVPLYNNGSSGSLVGWVTFTGVPSSAVSSTSTLTWFNETGATSLYSGGFTNQAVPTASRYNAALSDALTITSGTVVLSGGGLSDSITNAVTISNNTITVDPSATNGLSLTVSAATGEVIGTFVDGDRTNSIQSAILQNSTNAASGYFIGASQGGSFILFGN